MLGRSILSLTLSIVELLLGIAGSRDLLVSLLSLDRLGNIIAGGTP